MRKPTDKEIELQQEIAVDERELNEAIANAIAFESNAKSEMANLESVLPDVLLACIQGHGDEGRKREIRNRISELKADLSEMPFLDQGFEKSRAKITAKQSRERMCRTKRQSYEELKESLVNEPRDFGLAPAENLRNYAASLECTQDCESFIEDMQRVMA